jgi:hypothetical protein
MVIMLIQKTCSTLVACLFTCVFVVFIAGCSGGGAEEQAVTGTITPVPEIPVEEHYIDIAAISAAIVAVRVGQMATLVDNKSYAISSQPLSYSWSFSYKPDGSIAELQGATTSSPSFTPDVRGIYMVQLVVSAEGVSSQRAVTSVVATIAPERLTGPFNHPGLSSDCVNCHDGVKRALNGELISPKLANHVATTNMCQACHTPFGFADAPFVDHQEVFGNCSECHDGVLAIGKSEFHQPTEAECDSCHNTTHFLELEADGSFDHSGASNVCSSCHTGGAATGIDEDHIVTNTECGYCHTTVSFLPAYPDHTDPAVVGNGCDSCHGVSANDQATDPTPGHPVTNVDCDVCHSIETFSLEGTFDHSLVDPAVQPCESCHNDSNSINAPGKASAVPAHPATSSDCGSCHNIDSFTGAFVDHSNLVDNCASCHGVNASGKSFNHMPTTEDCSVCHSPGSFITGSFDHSGASFVGNCDSCHNNVISLGKLPNHIQTDPLLDCDACHLNTTDFADATFNHSGITNDCESCHNGDISTGKSGRHLPTQQDCNVCHVTTGPFKPAQRFSHSGITDKCESCHNGNRDYVQLGAIGKILNHIPALNECSLCHNNTNSGGFTSTTFLNLTGEHQKINSGCESCHISKFIPNNPAVVKGPDHLPVAQDCDVCHINTDFTPSIFAHTGISGNCASCHDGNVNNVAAGARGATTTPVHQSTTQDCGACHNTADFAGAFVDHSGPEVTGKSCDTCHDGVTATGKAAKTNPAHVPTNQDCNVCHVPGTFATTVFNHTGIVDNCASCHDGIAATGKNARTSPAHIPTSDDCSTCHITTAFSDTRFDHQGIVDNCTSCHNGTTARGKVPPPNHVPTNGDCSSCHQTTGFVPATFSHDGIVNNCRSCHDGVFAEGKSDSHVPTNQDCGICHTSSGFFGAVFDHTGIVDNCASSGCHTGIAGEASGKPVNHLQTAEDCSVCHAPGTFSTGIFDHIGVVNNCESCHNNVISTGKSDRHLPTQQDCSVCHITSAPFIPAQGFVHSGISNNCESCHDGRPDYVLLGARGAPATTIHLSTNEDCSVCHNTINFADAFVDHSDPDVVSKRCDSCHDGGAGGAIGKHSGHVVTNEDCSACHVPGTFTTAVFNHTGIVDNCVSCHDTVTAIGKNPSHAATSNNCHTCHTPLGFDIIDSVDHQEVFGNCSDCHNGELAIGKSEFHAPTNAECDDCHNTSHFMELRPDGSYDHSNILRECSGCHNDTVSQGKNEGHIVTSSECGSCHTTDSFSPAYPDHTDPSVIGNGCDSCHIANGTGSAMGQSAGHPVTNVDCGVCHGIVTFSLGGVFNHRLLDPVEQSCESCHNDSTSINAPSKSSAVPTHIVTNSDCGSCHITETFVGGFIDHTGPDVVGKRCDSCHGDTASGKSSNHMPTTEDCSVCHTPGTFTTGTYDHAGVTSGCTSCHDNTISVGKLPNHIPTSPDNQDCAVCHSTSSFAGATFDHTSTDTSNCLACHDGNISQGKSLGHIATEDNCSSCHNANNNGFSTFAGTFVHIMNIVGGDCASCHSTGIALPKKVNHIPAQAECSVCHSNTNTGGFALTTFLNPGGEHQKFNNGCEGCHISRFIINPLALKAPGHLPTAQDCNDCHTNDRFTPSIFNHSGISDNCASCHDGNLNHVSAGARGATNTALHRSTTQDCGVCHNTTNFADAFVDHSGPEVVGKRCDSCHDGGAGGAIGKHSGHVVTSEDCSVCHVPGTFANAVFNHTGIVDNCASCHDGNTATGATNTLIHQSTTEDCSVCHITTAFADARFDHTGITNNCASCHDGATARGKMPPPDHVPTTGDCSNCHQTTGFIPATFDHAGIVDNCSSCHDGAFATGKSGNHIPTSQDCGICHTTRLPLSFTGAIFDHIGINNNCVSCHDGSTAIGKSAKTNPAHLETSLDCNSCHTTATFIGGTWVHDASTAGNCDQCHRSGGGATAKPNGHLSTNEQCDVCHTTNGWAPTDFRHSSPGNYPGDHRRDPGCTGCHRGAIGGGINSDNYPDRLQYAPFCAGCHAGDFESEGDHNGGNNGTVEQNKNCGASGCHRVTSSGF